MRHLFFDLDGTLTDPAVGIVACIQHAVAAMSGPRWADADLRRFIGPPLRESFHEILATADTAAVERAVRHYRERFGSQGLYENELYAGMPEALARLQRSGHTLWVVTSKAKVYADRIIDHFGLRGHFSCVYGSELSGERGEKVELLAHVLEQERIEPASACMIGDRKYDVEGAKANGLSSLGVLWGYGSRSELEAAGADLIVEALAELPATVEQLARLGD